MTCKQCSGKRFHMIWPRLSLSYFWQCKDCGCLHGGDEDFVAGENFQ
jgi:uncharacterized Zn finger protein